MRAFLCSIDGSVWDAVDIGWTRPKEAKSTWDKAALAASNANRKHSMLFSVVCLQMNFTGFLTLPVPRKHGRYWRPPTKARRK